MLIRGGPVGGFDQDRSILAGLPRAVLLDWQAKLQTAILQGGMGGKPVSLSYTQGEGNAKRVDYALYNPAQAQALLMLVTRALGYPRSRSPMRPVYR